MNKVLMNKCDKIIKAADNNTLFYEDIINEIGKNKDLLKYSCTIPNAIEYIENAGITIMSKTNNTNEEEKINVSDEKESINEEFESNLDDNIEIGSEEEPSDEFIEDEDSNDTLDYYSEDSVNIYLKTIGYVQTRLLTSEEEKDLCIAAQAGDLEARNKMVTHNLKLVVSIAKRYIGINSSLDYIDIIQCGNMGLIKAIDRFDPEKGFKFSTYATWWIRQSITRAIADEGRNIRLPVHAVDQLRYIKRAVNELKTMYANDDLPSNEEIANYCNKHGWVIKTSNRQVISAEDVALYTSLATNSDTISLYTKIGEDEHGQETYLGDFIASDMDSVENEVIQNDLRRKFEYIFDNCLSPREATVLKLRYGFDTNEPMTLEQVGRIFGVTRERIRQIEEKAKRKIKTRSSINSLLK